MNLDDLTHAELDAVAYDRMVLPYPEYGTKAAKVAAIRAADPMPKIATVAANVDLSGWPRGEVRVTTVDDRLLRRAANGLVSILAAVDATFVPHPADPDVEQDRPDGPPAGPSGPEDPAPVPSYQDGPDERTGDESG